MSRNFAVQNKRERKRSKKKYSVYLDLKKW